MSLSDDFLATLSGAAIAGGVGLVTLWVQQFLVSRRQLSEEVLGPAFNYVVGLRDTWPWDRLPDPEWSKIDSYHWLRVPRKYRLPLRELSARIDSHGKSHAAYFQFMSETGWPSFASSVRAAWTHHLSSDPSALDARSLGVEGGPVVPLQSFVVGVVPYVLLNANDPEKAWGELSGSRGGTNYWTIQVIHALREKDPSAVTKLFRTMSDNPDAPKAAALVKSVQVAHEIVIQEAHSVRDLLARRLGLSREEAG